MTGTSVPDLGNSNNGGSNIYSNTTWALLNISSNNFLAEGNYWGTGTPENVIYHGNDSQSYGVVDFTPFSNVQLAPPLLTNMPTIIQQEITAAFPKVTTLHQNFPNPFNPETWIPYQLSQDAKVVIDIYEGNGQLIRTLNLDAQPAGYYTTREKAAYWDGRNDAGERISSGIYFYRLQAGDYNRTRKMIILK